jgi:hypothetical protein
MGRYPSVNWDQHYRNFRSKLGDCVLDDGVAQIVRLRDGALNGGIVI